MNYMEQVANMLGVELNEEFNINISGKTKLRFTENGLEYYYGTWLKCSELNELLAGKCEIVKIPKPIINEVERKYLSNIIKPWRDCVRYIFKQDSPDYEYIVIEYYDKPTEEKCKMFFPCFEKDKMYKGMQLYEKYKLEELGL